MAGSPLPNSAGRFWQSASSKEPYPTTVAGQNFWHYRASAAPQGGRQRLPCLPTLLFAHPPWLGWVVRVGGATGMAGSEVGGTEHRGAGSATGTVGCATSAADTGADAPTLERAACRPAAITVSAREPAGDHAACVASCSSLTCGARHFASCSSLTCGARHHARGFCAPRAQDHLGCTPCAVKAPCMVCCRGKTRWVVRRDPASCRKPALP